MEVAFGAPLRLEDRLLIRACDPAVVRDRSVGRKVGDAEVSAFERHVGVIPRDPRQARTIRARPRSRIEVAPGGDHLRTGRAVRRQHDEFVPRLALPMGLADADDQAGLGEDATVGIAQCVGFRGLRRDRARPSTRRVDAVEAAVVEA